MSGPTLPIGEDDLQAWVDCRLPPGRAEQVEAWLSARPAEAARVAAYRRQRDEVRVWLAPRLEAAVPSHLRASVIETARRSRIRLRLSAIAAAAALFLAGSGAGWLVRDSAKPAGSGGVAQQSDPALHMTTDAMRAHVTYVAENRHAVEVPASQEEHLISWLSNRLGRKLVVPELAPFGFRLMGGRLLPTEQAPAAQFMYVDNQGVRLTLYLRAERSERETGFEMVERGGVFGFRWIEHGFGYAVLAETGRDRLLAVAKAISQQLPLHDLEPKRSQ